MFAGGAVALASSLVDNADGGSNMLYVKGRKARVYRSDALALSWESPEALHVLADTDAFAPHRSSKTTADRFDVRTLLDEEELERFSCRRAFHDCNVNRQQKYEHEEEEEEYDYERYHDMPSGDHKAIEPSWVPLPGDSDEEEEDKGENSRFQPPPRRNPRRTQYGHYGPCTAPAAGQGQWSMVAPIEEVERKDCGNEENGDVGCKVDIQSPLDELDKFEPSEHELQAGCVLPASLRHCLIVATTAQRAQISPQLEVILRLRQGSSHAFGFLDIHNSLNPFYTFLKSLSKAKLEHRVEELKSLQCQNEHERQANSTARGLLGETYFSSSDSSSSSEDEEEGDEKNPSGGDVKLLDVPTEMTAAVNTSEELETLPPRKKNKINFVKAEAQDENVIVDDLEVVSVDSCLDALLEKTLQKKNRATKRAPMMGENGLGSEPPTNNNAQEYEEKLRANRRKRAKLLSNHFKQQSAGQNMKP